MEQDTGLYGGSSGIALFLLYMWKETGNEIYRDHAYRAMKAAIQVVKAKDAHVNPTFVSGDLGIAYVLSEFARLGAHDDWADEAVSIAVACGSQITWDRLPCEYIGGKAGMLLALTHIFDLYPSDELFGIIGEGVRSLIANVRFSRSGVYWDVVARQCRGPTGFAHGTSGTAAALAEVLGYFRAEQGAFGLVERAFFHESHFFREWAGAWCVRFPGARPDELDAHLRKVYENAEYDPNKYYSISDSWCHGSAGGVLARLDPGRHKLPREIVAERRIAVRELVLKLTRRPWGKLCLCHGASGTYLALAEARADAKEVDIPDHAAFEVMLAADFGRKGFCREREDGARFDAQSFGLFTGRAGIGLSLVYDPTKDWMRNVLFPRMSAGRQSGLGYSLTEEFIEQAFDAHPASKFMDCRLRGDPGSGEVRASDRLWAFSTSLRDALVDGDNFIAWPDGGTDESSENCEYVAAAVYEAGMIEESLSYIQDKMIRNEGGDGLGELITNPSAVVARRGGRRWVVAYEQSVIRVHDISPLCCAILEHCRRRSILREVYEGIVASSPLFASVDREAVEAQVRELVCAGLLVSPRHYSLLNLA